MTEGATKEGDRLGDLQLSNVAVPPIPNGDHPYVKCTMPSLEISLALPSAKAATTLVLRVKPALNKSIASNQVQSDIFGPETLVCVE